MDNEPVPTLDSLIEPFQSLQYLIAVKAILAYAENTSRTSNGYMFEKIAIDIRKDIKGFNPSEGSDLDNLITRLKEEVEKGNTPAISPLLEIEKLKSIEF